MSKAGAVLIALLTTGMAEGDAQKKDLWMFISGMSASLRHYPLQPKQCAVIV
jgi:threonine dehydratase